MLIVRGSKLCGKVVVVPDLFHVETGFGHLWYIPPIPVRSFVVLGKGENGFQGIEIPLSFRSILLAWLRAGFLFAGIWARITTGAMADEGK